MKTLCDEARNIFCQLIQKMEGRSHLRIDNEPMMPLVIENLNTIVSTSLGQGTLYSLTNYFMRGNSLLCDPEMCFIIIDNRTQDSQSDLVTIIPYSYQQDLTGINQESISIVNSTATNIIQELQFEHKLFADYWLLHIRDTKYL